MRAALSSAPDIQSNSVIKMTTQFSLILCMLEQFQSCEGRFKELFVLCLKYRRLSQHQAKNNSVERVINDDRLSLRFIPTGCVQVSTLKIFHHPNTIRVVDDQNVSPFPPRLRCLMAVRSMACE